MYAFDASHFDIRGGARAGDIRCKARRLRDSAQSIRAASRQSGVARRMQRWKSGSRVRTRRPSVDEWWRTMVPESATAAERACDNAVAVLDLRRGQRLWSIFHSNAGLSHSVGKAGGATKVRRPLEWSRCAMLAGSSAVADSTTSAPYSRSRSVIRSKAASRIECTAMHVIARQVGVDIRSRYA